LVDLIPFWKKLAISRVALLLLSVGREKKNNFELVTRQGEKWRTKMVTFFDFKPSVDCSDRGSIRTGG